jgi:hypothetical protein
MEKTEEIEELYATVGRFKKDFPSYPSFLVKACNDSFSYGVKLKNGEVIKFESAEPINNEWVILSGVENKEYDFERGMEIRVSEIVWIIDDFYFKGDN